MSNCWDVQNPASLTHDQGGDALGIVSMVNYTIDRYSADRERVYVMGFSSGGMMTNVMAGSYPDVFEAGAAYSGTPHACFAGKCLHPQDPAYQGPRRTGRGTRREGKQSRSETAPDCLLHPSLLVLYVSEKGEEAADKSFLVHRCPLRHTVQSQPDLCPGSPAHPGAVGQLRAQLVSWLHRTAAENADLARRGRLPRARPVRH